MQHQNFSITKDGFGIHTFELNMPCITNKRLRKIMKHIAKNNINHFNIPNSRNLVIYPSQEGMRVHLICAPNGINEIKVIVSPAKILDENAEPTAILTKGCDFNRLHQLVNSTIAEALGKDYHMDNFYLSRIDLCVNIMLSETYSAERYIKLIKRSMKYSKYDEVDEFNSDKPNSYNKNKHSFRIKTGMLVFTAYDKYFQLDDIGKNYDTMSKGMLRLEIAVDREHICKAERTCNFTENIHTLEGYAQVSRDVFIDYIQKYFCEGSYYCLTAMRKMINESSFSRKAKLNMLTFAESQFSRKSFRSAKKHIIKELDSESKCRKIMEHFEILNMNPMSLAHRDKHGEEVIPGLYELLGI